MAQIFISHSQYDEDIRTFFDEVFAGTKVKAIRVEFEKMELKKYNLPLSEFIIHQLKTSDALFVLLGPNINRSQFTQSWVGFETGFAVGWEHTQHIWVFEPMNHAPIQFPIPFLHHYVPYVMSDGWHDYIKSIVKAYEQWIPAARPIPKGKLIQCPHKDCKMQYVLHTKTSKFYCPVCRKSITLKS